MRVSYDGAFTSICRDIVLSTASGTTNVGVQARKGGRSKLMGPWRVLLSIR